MMKERIIEEIKKMSGSLIGIGTDDGRVLETIEDNDNIDLCYILSNGGNGSKKKFKLFRKGRTKKVNIKKLSKYFRLRSIDNIVCDYGTVKKYIRSFIGESIYISRGKIYIYGNIKDLNSLEERYKRYNSSTQLIKNNKAFLLIVNSENSKINIFKNTLYKIRDFFSDGIELITDFLIN